MTSITASDLLVSELDSLKQMTEIRTPEGRVLGYFAPVEARQEELYAEAARQIDPAEVKRRKQAREPGYTIDEVLSHLQSLESGACSATACSYPI